MEKKETTQVWRHPLHNTVGLEMPECPEVAVSAGI